MSQRRFGVVSAVMAIVCSLFAVLPALADSNVRIVRLSHITGDAQVQHDGKDQGFSHAVMNMPVTSGMWLYTPGGSRAEVQFENGSTVRLVEDAQIQFEKLALAKNGGKINTIGVDHGIVYFNFSNVDKHDQVVIDANGRTFRVTKPSRLRLDLNDKVVSLAVLKGQVEMEGEMGPEIKNDHTLFLNPNNADMYKVAKGTDKFGSDAWDKERDEQLVVASNHSTPFATNGFFDAQYASLGAYGNFMMLPGYGNVWQPFNMGMGWNPYMNGTWGFYPGMGYAWISSDPWGWAPYRYGQWNYTAANGWFWAPGANMTAWNLGPSLGAVPAGFHAPTAPTVTSGARPTQMVVVGHPSNVHPTILAGHPTLNARAIPASRTVQPSSGMSAANARYGGTRSASSRGTSMHSAGPSLGGSPHVSASSTAGTVGTSGRPR